MFLKQGETLKQGEIVKQVKRLKHLGHLGRLGQMGHLERAGRAWAFGLRSLVFGHWPFGMRLSILRLRSHCQLLTGP